MKHLSFLGSAICGRRWPARLTRDSAKVTCPECQGYHVFNVALARRSR